MPLEPRRLHELSPIDPRTVAIVRASCARLSGDPIALTEEFYRQLFELAPGTRAMFPSDLTPQTEKLLAALLAAVDALDRPDRVEGMLRRLGAGHRRRHGVTNEMYVYVGHALVRAVSRLSGHMESSVGSAWIAVYEWLAAVMIAGAEEGVAALSGAVEQEPHRTATAATYPTRASRRVSLPQPDEDRATTLPVPGGGA